MSSSVLQVCTCQINFTRSVYPFILLFKLIISPPSLSYLTTQYNQTDDQNPLPLALLGATILVWDNCPKHWDEASDFASSFRKYVCMYGVKVVIKCQFSIFAFDKEKCPPPLPPTISFFAPPLKKILCTKLNPDRRNKVYNIIQKKIITGLTFFLKCPKPGPGKRRRQLLARKRVRGPPPRPRIPSKSSSKRNDNNQKNRSSRKAGASRSTRKSAWRPSFIQRKPAFTQDTHGSLLTHLNRNEQRESTL